MVSTDSSIITTHIDPVKKVYWIDDAGKTIANAVKSMHFDMQPVTAADTLRLDSLGSGGMIDGYNTIHFREHSATRMSVSTPSINSVTTHTMISDYYVAPVHHAASKQRMAKIGDVVRTVAQSSTNVDDLFKFQITTTTDRISDTVAVVPDSMFTVPAGYTKVTPTPAASLPSAPAVP